MTMQATPSLLDNLERNADPKSANDGFKYEVQLLLLFMLRATLQGVKFKVTSNVKGFGTFDDLVAECEFPGGLSKLICVQAKHKADASKLCLSLELLQGKKTKKSEFNVEKYYDSIQISKIQDALQNGASVDVEYVIYTNIATNNTVEWICGISHKSADLLNTSGEVTQIDPSKNDSIINKNEEKNKRADFLERLVFLTKQKNVDEMKNEIITLLQKLLHIHDKEYCISLYRMLEAEVTKLYYKFTPISDQQFNIILMLAKQEMCHAQFKLKIQNLSNEVGLTVDITSLLNEKFETGIQGVCVTTEDSSTLLTTIKVYQALRHRNNFIFVNIMDLEKVLLLFELQMNLIVVNFGQEMSPNEQELNKLIEILNNHKEKKAIFIVQRDKVPKCLESYSKIIMNYSFSDFDAAIQKSLLGRYINLQGCKMHMQELLEQYSTSIIDFKTAMQLLKNEEVIVGKKPQELDSSVKACYISRHLYSGSLRKEVFKNLQRSDIFFIEVKTLNGFEQRYILYKEDQDLPLQDINIVLYEHKVGTNRYEAFENFVKQNAEKENINFHFLVWNEEFFFWRRTVGDIKNIQCYISAEDDGQFNTEDRLVNENENTVTAIVDKPGMGKTTFLRSIASKLKKKYSKLLVYYCDLKLNPIFKLKPSECMRELKNASSALKLLKNKILCLESVFHANLFDEIVSKQKIHLCLDGFDELKTEYAECFVSFLVELLKETNGHIQIWITSRESKRKILQENFCILAFTMKPFDTNNKENYLKKHYYNESKTVAINVRKEDIDKFCDVLQGDILQMKKSVQDILGIPMIITIVASINNDNFLTYCKSEDKIPNTITSFEDISELYHEFVYRFLERHLKLKLNTNEHYIDDVLTKQIEESIKMYGIIALKALCKEIGVELSRLENELFNTYLEQYNKNLIVKCGIVYEFNEPIQFLHRTVAEYFVAKYVLTSVCKVTSDPENIFSIVKFGTILLGAQNSMIRKFMDPLLRNISLLLPEIFEFLKNVLSLKSAMKEDNLHVFEFIVKTVISVAWENNFDLTSYLNNRKEKSFSAKCLSFAVCGGKPSLYKKDNITSRHYNTVNDGTSPLMYAALKGRNETVSLLLDNGADISDECDNNATALIYAAYNGHKDVVSLLLDRGANINTTDDDGISVLMIAIITNQIDLVSLLLERGADTEIECRYDSTALFYAAFFGYIDIVSRLLNYNANINHTDKNLNSALLIAVSKGHIATALLLINKGADFHKTNVYDESVLMLSAYSGVIQVVRELLKLKANIHQCNVDGVSILMHAADNGHKDTVSLLLENNANINHKNHNDETALIRAACCGHTEVVSLLLEHSADINDLTKEKNSVLMIAASKGHKNIVSLLLKRGANVHHRNEKNATALSTAVCNANVDVVSLLLENGKANVFDKNSYGSPVLFSAVLGTNCECIPVLLEHGADINEVNNNGDTALHTAVVMNHTKNNEECKGNIWACKILVENGAKVDIKNKNGLTPLDLAIQLKHTECANILQSHVQIASGN